MIAGRVLARVGDERIDNSRDAGGTIEPLADDAGRRHEDFVWRRADRLGGGLGDMSDGGCSDASVKALALPELTISARASPPLQMLTAPSTAPSLRAREHARDRRWPSNKHHHDIGSAPKSAPLRRSVAKRTPAIGGKTG